MIIFIHGDDIKTSRNYLLEIKKKNNAQTFYADFDDPLTLLQQLQGENLFGEKKVLVIENIFSKKSVSNFKLLESRVKQANSIEIYIWEPKELSKTQLATFGKSESKLFKIPQKVFYFLDSIAPGNSSNIRLFHETLDGADEEFIFFMLIRQFRLMLNLIDQDFDIDEVKRLAPWQKNKLLSQAKKFGIKGLLISYKKLFKIESRVKVGTLNMPLANAIDIFLAEI